MGSLPDRSVDAATIKTLLSQIAADPQLPVANPTASMWQEELHPLSHTRSSQLCQQ